MTIRLKFRKIRGREGLESLLFRPWENTEGWMQMGKTMEEKAFREHVSWVMFLLSILVIWAHSYNAELFSGGAPVTEGIWLTVHRIQDFLSAALGLTAVPGFFMLSAYLFFRSFSWEKLPAKWKSRVRSVAVPYLAWNLFYYLGYVLATRIPAVYRLIGKPPVPFNGEELLAAVLHYQYAPVFWYLYQLMFLILLSPVLYWIIKNRTRGLVFLGSCHGGRPFSSGYHASQHRRTSLLFLWDLYGRPWPGIDRGFLWKGADPGGDRKCPYGSDLFLEDGEAWGRCFVDRHVPFFPSHIHMASV